MLPWYRRSGLTGEEAKQAERRSVRRCALMLMPIAASMAVLGLTSIVLIGNPLFGIPIALVGLLASQRAWIALRQPEVPTVATNLGSAAFAVAVLLCVLVAVVGFTMGLSQDDVLATRGLGLAIGSMITASWVAARMQPAQRV